MLPDSINVGVIAENIKKLETMVQEAGSELPTPEAGDVGKILKVGSDGYELAEEYSYTPPAYSTTEVNTGRKWVDGKDVYMVSFTDTEPVNAKAILLPGVGNVISIIGTVKYTASEQITYCDLTCYSSSTLRTYCTIKSGISGYEFKEYWNLTDATVNSISATIYYTKQTPVPSNETKKKTSKKGE